MSLLAPVKANAMFEYHETKLVPADRLFANLKKQFERDTNSFTRAYDLARLHSMAYATKLVELTVTKDAGKLVFGDPGSDSGVPQTIQTFKTPQNRQAALQQLTNAIRLYERAIVLLKKSTNVNEQQWMILPTQLGLAWCLDQSGQRERALDAYRKTLKIAWHQEVTGDFELKEWVNDVWNDVKARRNPIHSRNRGSLRPGVCYCEETIRYMLKLLDPSKDQSEIAELKERQNKLLTMGRSITPIVIPLTEEVDLSGLVNPRAGIEFDLDGSGLPRKWGWTTPKAAWLVYDSDGLGQIGSGLQMFGNVTFWIFWRDGYAALSALDDNDDGVLNGPELIGLALWRDLNCNGVSDPGEVLPVAALGISSISCGSQPFSETATWNPRGVTFTNGAVRPTYDWIAPSE